MQPLVSVIVPFYNAERNSSRVRAKIKSLTTKKVEVILVDDGSTDATIELLAETASEAKVPTAVIQQDNRGPGGARNAGFKLAKGTFVWFVDCDDDFSEDALELLIQQSTADYDFIDFNVRVGDRPSENSMGWTPGVHTVSSENRATLARNFGRLHSKAFRREWLANHEVFYPEYCLFEDTPLFFELPFLTKSFLKSEIVGYFQYLDFDSVTRGKLSPRYFDRLWNVSLGLEQGLRLAKSEQEKSVLIDQFNELFLVRVFQQLKARLFSPRASLMSIIRNKDFFALIREIGLRIELAPHFQHFSLMLRVMTRFRAESRRLNVPVSYSKHIGQLSRTERVSFRAMWFLSFLRPNQPAFFDDLRQKAWGREFTPSPDVLAIS